jgi:hypothetical protein
LKARGIKEGRENRGGNFESGKNRGDAGISH